MAAIVPTVGSVSRPRSHGYDGYVGNILIRLAASEDTPLETVTADSQAQRIDTSDSAEDIRDEVGQRYSRSNLSGGAGMDFLHSPLRPEDSAIRYWDSRGVDVFGTDKGEAYASTLMNEMLFETSAGDIAKVVQIDGVVYYLNGARIYEQGNATEKATLSAAGIDMVALGNSLFTMDATDGVERFDPPTWTSTNVSATTTFTKIWGVKGRIVGVVDNVLYEAAASDLTLITLSPNDTVTDVIDAGPAVLVFTTDGSIYALTLDDTFALVETNRTPFIDEVPIMAANSLGIIGIVTAETTAGDGRVSRFYTAGIDQTGGVVDLQLVFQVGDRETTDDLAPTALLATRDSIYVAIPDEGETSTTLWRYYTPTAGYARSYELGTTVQHDVLSLAETDDRMWAAVALEGVWMEHDTYVGKGYVIGPLADFSSAESKQWVQGEITGVSPSTTELVLKDSNDVSLLTDISSASWQYITRINSYSERTLSVDMVGKKGRYHLAKVEFYSDTTGASTPSLWSYSFRAMPAPERDQLLRIPINISDQIEAPGRRAITIKGRGDALREALMAYEGVNTLIEIWRPVRKIQGIIERFEEPITTIPKRGSTGLVMYMRVRGRKLSVAGYDSTPTLGSSLAQNQLGTVTLGVGESP